MPKVKRSEMKDLGHAINLAELLEAIHSAEKYFDNRQVWCRGQARSDWTLIPTAYRRNSVLESQMANHFRLRALSLFKACPSHIDYAAWLPLMRHYGLPTRLLDWTESVCVAAFFATNYKREPGDSAIWVLSPGHLNCLSIGDFIPFLSDSRVRPLAEAAFHFGKSHNITIATLAPRSDPRMAAQLCNFTIHGLSAPLEDHSSSSKFLGRIRIPESAHDRINHDLSLLGIRLSNLFPDLEHLAEELSQLKAIGLDGENLEKKD
jgi:hypothetical protein